MKALPFVLFILSIGGTTMDDLIPMIPDNDLTINGLDITLTRECVQLINDELNLTFTCNASIQDIYDAFKQGIDELTYADTKYSKYETLRSLMMQYDNIGQQIWSVALKKTHLIIENEDETAYALEQAKQLLDDDAAMQCVSIFDEWRIDVDYKAGDRLRYMNKLYKVLQNHHSQIDWTPDKAVSLFVDIADPADPWPEWVRPTMAEDAYPMGAQVTHNGKKYISQIDANTTEPGTDERWWKEVTEEES